MAKKESTPFDPCKFAGAWRTMRGGGRRYTTNGRSPPAAFGPKSGSAPIPATHTDGVKATSALLARTPNPDRAHQWKSRDQSGRESLFFGANGYFRGSTDTQRGHMLRDCDIGTRHFSRTAASGYHEPSLSLLRFLLPSPMPCPRQQWRDNQ